MTTAHDCKAAGCRGSAPVPWPAIAGALMALLLVSVFLVTGASAFVIGLPAVPTLAVADAVISNAAIPECAARTLCLQSVRFVSERAEAVAPYVVVSMFRAGHKVSQFVSGQSFVSEYGTLGGQVADPAAISTRRMCMGLPAEPTPTVHAAADRHATYEVGVGLKYVGPLAQALLIKRFPSINLHQSTSTLRLYQASYEQSRHSCTYAQSNSRSVSTENILLDKKSRCAACRPPASRSSRFKPYLGALKGEAAR